MGALLVLFLPLGLLVQQRWAPLVHLDASVEASTHADAVEHGWLRASARALTWLGAPPLLIISCVLIAVLLVRAGRRRSALYLAVCMIGAYSLSSTSKLFVARARPFFVDPISSAHGYSFPSGHATGAAAFYLAAAVLLLSMQRRHRATLLGLAIALPLVVAATRVVMGVHYLTDVTAGLLVGWGWTVACTGALMAWRAKPNQAISGSLHDPSHTED